MTGTRTRALVNIGQQWRRRRGGTVFVVYQVHRADRLVQLRHPDGMLYPVSFRDLRRYYELQTDDPRARLRRSAALPALHERRIAQGPGSAGGAL